MCMFYLLSVFKGEIKKMLILIFMFDNDEEVVLLLLLSSAFVGGEAVRNSERTSSGATLHLEASARPFPRSLGPSSSYQPSYRQAEERGFRQCGVPRGFRILVVFIYRRPEHTCMERLE